MSNIPLQQGILNTPIEVFQSGIANCLQFYAQHDNLPTQDAVEFLQDLALISSTAKRKLAATDPQNTQQVKQLLADLLQQDLANIQRELAFNLQRAKDQSAQDQKQFAQQIQQALDYQNDVAQRINTARSDKAPYDYLSSIGVLLESMIFVAQVDPTTYARGFKLVASAGNSYEKLLSDQHGGEVIYPGVAPTPTP